MPNEQDKWLPKIQKLIAKAERAGTPEEAESFYAKAQQLMTKWAIDEAMLSREGKSQDEIIREHMTIKRSGLFPVMVQMYSAVATANDVRVLVYSPKWKEYAGVDLIGWKSDVEKVKMMYASLWLQCTREGNRQTPDYIKAAGRTTLGRWRHSFKVAYALRIGTRLEESRKATIKEESGISNSKALAVIDRAAAVDNYVNQIPTKTARRSRMNLDYEGANAGRKAADRADIGNTRIGNNQGQIGH